MDEESAEAPVGRLPGFDEIEDQCWQDFLGSSTLLLDVINRRLLDRHDLTLFDFLMLDVLARSAGGSARMGDLAHVMVVAPSRLTELMRRMESLGLARRTRSQNDGRGVIASITSEGRARVRPAARTYVEAIRAFYLAQLSRPQMIALGDSCRRISVPLKASVKSKLRHDRRGSGR